MSDATFVVLVLGLIHFTRGATEHWLRRDVFHNRVWSGVCLSVLSTFLIKHIVYGYMIYMLEWQSDDYLAAEVGIGERQTLTAQSSALQGLHEMFHHSCISDVDMMIWLQSRGNRFELALIWFAWTYIAMVIWFLAREGFFP
ncbi:uncharacterized protein BO72DRAFT_456526 [Aspergillus fijiensis CBS 313.89]|uniref:Uncharacterized protein n=1 Tax=Aspergillus fijiensis CBS 313.89 TaxID=1448319 RepID=A0A8G1RVG5_9EURO|nr:uncharacterized protein BO72DRAFT_456526 [Aspergillus fijiensis CBS 313.89]RAK80285.1 hypothetical protein BO72DRAFT_456526 [Aspergillus fijiensis CBS 313.89]